jgi:hypothetical protein
MTIVPAASPAVALYTTRIVTAPNLDAITIADCQPGDDEGAGTSQFAPGDGPRTMAP